MMEQNIALLRQHCYHLGIFLRVCARHLYYFFFRFLFKMENGTRWAHCSSFYPQASNQIKHHLRASSSFFGFFFWFNRSLSPSRLIYRFHLLFSQSCPNIIFAILLSPFSPPQNRFNVHSIFSSHHHLDFLIANVFGREKIHASPIITLNAVIHFAFFKEKCIKPWTPECMSEAS